MVMGLGVRSFGRNGDDIEIGQDGPGVRALVGRYFRFRDHRVHAPSQMRLPGVGGTADEDFAAPGQ